MHVPSLVVADLHTCKNNLNEVVYLLRETLPALYDMHKCRSLVIVGDLLNSVSQIDTEVYTILYQELKKWRDRDVRIVAGNHDMYSYNTLITPLIPFENICKIYTQYTRDGMFEFVPYSNNAKTMTDIEYMTTPGGTFIHYAIDELLSAMNIPYSMPCISGLSKNRVYMAGHVHVPVMKENFISLGCPVQYMFDLEKNISNNAYVLQRDFTVTKIDLNITRFNVFEIQTVSDLEKVDIKKGAVSTYVKLKILSDSITPSDILEFKKNNANVTVVIEKMAKPRTTHVIANKNISKPLDIYREFIKSSDTTMDKRALYSIVDENLRGLVE